MSLVSRCILGFVVLTTFAVRAEAQQPLLLDISNGQVTLKAQNVPVRVILMEWARVGGTNVVGADRMTGAPVTMELTGVPERQALDVLLRNASGYLLAMRPSGTAGASAYNRILIMPPSTAPRALPNPTFAAGGRVPVNVPEPTEDQADIDLDNPGPQGRPAPPVRMPTVTGQSLPAGGGQPPSALPLPDTSAPVSPQGPGTAGVTPGNPFGIPQGSSSSPGVIVPAPPPPQQAPD